MEVYRSQAPVHSFTAEERQAMTDATMASISGKPVATQAPGTGGPAPRPRAAAAAWPRIRPCSVDAPTSRISTIPI